MKRLLLLACPLLLAFAPVPRIRPIDDPDQAIYQFDRQCCASDQVPEDRLTSRKSHLVRALEDLQERLERRGKSEEAAAVHDRAVLADSLSTTHRLGSDRPGAILRDGSVSGKYRHLLHVIHSPNDQNAYTTYRDFGYWSGKLYASHQDLKPGHWVYVYPRWFIWRDGPSRP